uniref:Uncharacterized protein n=1 Tax=Setaria italica TaxID=4555 RepID=K3YKK8_SETIT
MAAPSSSSSSANRHQIPAASRSWSWWCRAMRMGTRGGCSTGALVVGSMAVVANSTGGHGTKEAVTRREQEQGRSEDQ